MLEKKLVLAGISGAFGWEPGYRYPLLAPAILKSVCDSNPEIASLFHTTVFQYPGLDTFDAIFNDLAHFRPDIIGFSVFI